MNLSCFDSFPLLETTRLCLRALVDDDAASVFDVFRHDAVTEHYDLETMPDLGRAVTLIGFLRRRYEERSGIRWAIVERDTGTFLGTIGINSINVPARRIAIGYELAPQFWGKGFATEAVTAIVSFGHQSLLAHRIEATVLLKNKASMRVLQKTGFAEEGVLRAYGHWKGQFHDMRMFSILRKSWAG